MDPKSYTYAAVYSLPVKTFASSDCLLVLAIWRLHSPVVTRRCNWITKIANSRAAARFTETTGW